MNILLTNDDGIDSEGLLCLAKALRERTDHSVYVLAPDSNRSGVSHSISFLREPLKIVERSLNTWACSGNPADCVQAAVQGALSFKPDLVISGINQGANIGTDLIYSGTAGAARQAGLNAIPGIALSLAGRGTEEFYWESAAAFAVEHLEEFRALWREDIFINVNIPNNPVGPGGMIPTFPSVRQYIDTFSLTHTLDGRLYCFLDISRVETLPEEGSDWDAISRNLVSVSPVFLYPVVRGDLCPAAPDHARIAAPRKGIAWAGDNTGDNSRR
jgi:5'-nucleotidase